MSERAKLSILTFFEIPEVARAKFSLVLIRVIEFLYTVVSFVTVITIRAFLMVLNEPALL